MSHEQQSFLEGPNKGEFLVPSNKPTEQCRSCGARIVWGETERGKAIPLDIAHVRLVRGVRYATTHYAHCPHAKQWRRS